MSHLSVNFLNSLGSVIDAIELPNSHKWKEENIGFSLIDHPFSGLMDRDNKKILFSTGFSHHLLNYTIQPFSTYTCYGRISDVTVFEELTYYLIVKLNQQTVRNAKSVVVEMIE